MVSPVEVSEVWQDTFVIGHHGRVIINQDSGSVTIGSWDRPEARVTATKRGSAGDEATARRALARLIVRPSLFGSRLSIEVGGAAGILESLVGWGFGGRGSSGRVDVDVTVPRGAEVAVDTGLGPVLAEDLSGRLHVDTGSGAVTIARCAGLITVDTGSGPVDVRNTGGEIDVDTGRGAVRLDQVRATRINVDVGYGGITGTFVPLRDGDYRFDTGNGAIDLRIPPGATGQFDLETAAGKLLSDLPLNREGVDPRRLRGILGRASCVVRCRSGRGDIIVLAAADLRQPGRASEPSEPAEAREPAGTHPDLALTPARRRLAVDDQDYLRVLKMVEEKRITPDAAERLLIALEEDDGGSSDDQGTPPGGMMP